MTTFTGWDGLAARRSGRLSGVSVDLVSGAAPAALYAGLRPGQRVCAGPDADGRWQHVPQFVSWSTRGHSAWLNNLWDKVLVQPRRYETGPVLSDRLWPVEVWNTHRAQMRPLTAIQISGLGGLEIQGPTALDFWPGQSQIYTARLPRVGDSVIEALVTWVFPDESGADHRVVGQRMVLWSYEPDWAEIPVEALEWKTDVLRAYSGQEQRIQLRGKPRRRLAYTYTFEDARQGARAQAQIWGWQHQVFGVPFWQDHQVLVEDLPAGSMIVTIDTTVRDFAAGAQIALWASYLDWEVVAVDTLTASTLTLKRPTLRAWNRGARVLPLNLGRMPRVLDIGRATTTLAECRVEWALEPESGLAANRMVASDFPVYQSYEVLTEEPDWSKELGEQAERDFESVDAEVGPVVVDAHTTAPEYGRPFHWVLQGRSSIARFLAFLEARKGRCVPFWLPTYALDFEQAATAGATDAAILVHDIQYSLYYAQHLNRRDLAFFPTTGGAPVLRRILDSTPVGADLERLTLDQAFGSAKIPSDWRCISLLAFVRMDQDSVQLEWETDELVRVSFRVKEILL